MANAITKLVVAGLLAVLPVSAGNPKRAEKAAPDVLVYVVDSSIVTPWVLLQAEATATRMFAGIGLRVQWTERGPSRGAAPGGSACAPKWPREIGVRMALQRTSSASREALALALPYKRTGVQITIFYGALRDALIPRPRLAPVVLAHVLAHEIAHTLEGAAHHSATGVMRAHWNSRDFADMEEGPLEFGGFDAELIHRGMQNRQSSGCAAVAALSGHD